MIATIRVIAEHSGLPERHFISTGVPDFPGDPPAQMTTDDLIYIVICSVCGLVEKASTDTEAETRGDLHLQKHHRRPEALRLYRDRNRWDHDR